MGLKNWILKHTGNMEIPTEELSLLSCYADNYTNCLTEEDIVEMQEQTTLAGSFKDTVTRFILTPDRMVQIWVAISAVVVWEELLTFFIVGFVLPLVLKKKKDAANDTDKTSKDKDDHTHTYITIGQSIANHIAQLAQLAFAIYMVDIIKVILQSVGIEFMTQGDLPHAFANILYMAWIVNRISAVKRFILAKQTCCNPDHLKGQVQLVDRLMDAVLYCVGIYAMVDSVQDDLGAAAKGFVALGSVGTMVIGLASQGLAAQLFNGLFLASSNRIAVGDFVRFSNGVSGTVIKLGWMETVLRVPDETMVTVPNKDLADLRVSNLSRVTQSAFQQTLRFKYSDIDKLQDVLDTIKEEVKKACPEVISDGARPFRAYLTAYKPDHIEAKVDFRFKLKPTGEAFHKNRQNTLMAIAKAVKQYDIEFAVVDVAAVSAAIRLISTTQQEG